MTVRLMAVVCLFAALSLTAQVAPEVEPPLPPAPPEVEAPPLQTASSEPAVASERKIEVFTQEGARLRSEADVLGTNGALLLEGPSDVVLKVFNGPIRFLTNTGSERMRINSDGGVTLNYVGTHTARLLVQHGTDNSQALFVTHQPAFEVGSPVQTDYGLFVQTHENVHAGATNSGGLYGAYVNSWETGPGSLAWTIGARIESGTSGAGAAGGTVSNAIGAQLKVVAASGSTVTNGQALYINDVQATNDWGIYQVGTDDDNYFAGRVGIGVTQPADMVHLSAATNTGIRMTHTDASSAMNAITFYEGGSLYGFINQRGSTYAGQSGQFNIGNNHVSGNTALWAGSLARMTLYSNGSVGIGTTSAPAEKLSVVGDVRTTGNLVVTGNINATTITGATVIGAVYQDVAEWVPATVDMEPGTVVVLNHDRTNEVMPSHSAYDTSVAGVVSAQPGVLLGVAADSKEQIATTGRVKVRVDARRAPIRVGDLLVTSDVPGTAMRSEPMDINGRHFHQPGTIIGKALEPLESGTGEILVLLSMQ